jgi:Icc-related predicted phosphoesterase
MSNNKNDAETTFLSIGDVHGHWNYVIKAIESASDILGHVPGLVLQVGDAEALRSEADLETVHTPGKYRSMGTFSALAPGDLPCPVYFIGGNHEPYEMLDIAEMNSHTVPIPWGSNVYYLGRAGAMPINGLNIAWLSGVERGEMLPVRNIGKKELTYYLESEVDLAKRKGAMLGDIDVVVTHDWPSGIRDGRGTELIRSITEKLEPQLHVCGHMHSHHEAVIGKTRVHALSAVPSEIAHDGRYGWWRLYSKENGWIRSIQVGGQGSVGDT